jgi:hypothetical protein
MITGFKQHMKQPPLSPFFKGEFQWQPAFAPFAPWLLAKNLPLTAFAKGEFQ